MAKKKEQVATPFRSRIVEQRMVRIGDIVGMPENFRTHPVEQHQAVEESLEELGLIDAFDVWVRSDGALCLFDGHLRRQLVSVNISKDTLVPCNVTDLTESEAKKALLVKDSIGKLAEIDEDKLKSLMAAVPRNDGDMQQMMASAPATTQQQSGSGSPAMSPASPGGLPVASAAMPLPIAGVVDVPSPKSPSLPLGRYVAVTCPRCGRESFLDRYTIPMKSPQ